MCRFVLLLALLLLIAAPAASANPLAGMPFWVDREWSPAFQDAQRLQAGGRTEEAALIRKIERTIGGSRPQAPVARTRPAQGHLEDRRPATPGHASAALPRTAPRRI